MSDSLVVPVGLALALGLLIGLQREWVVDRVAGIRTFPLITVLGVITAEVAPTFGPAAGLFALGLLMSAANLARARTPREASENSDFGVTTEVAALVMFGVGVMLFRERLVPALVVTGVVAVLLQWKASLHAFTRRLHQGDLEAVTRLVLLALVVLPVLPNRSYDPWQVVNPFEIWLMVVLIVAISLAGYVAFRFLGPRRGVLVSGLLGGLISSTATTLSSARRSRDEPRLAEAGAVVTVLASAFVFVRVLVEVALIAPGDFARIAPPLTIVLSVMALSGWVLMRRYRPAGDVEPLAIEAPSDVGAALMFGLLYAAVLLGVAIARQHWGDAGLFLVAALSGLTDVDAITLSSSRLLARDAIDAHLAWRLILTGALANIALKGVAVLLLADRKMMRGAVSAFVVALGTGLAVLALWPL